MSDVQELTYQDLLDLGTEMVKHVKEPPPPGFNAAMFWATQPAFIAACQKAYALGIERAYADPSFVRLDTLEPAADEDDIRSEGYGAALKDLHDWATETKDEAALSWVAEKTLDEEGGN